MEERAIQRYFKKAEIADFVQDEALRKIIDTAHRIEKNSGRIERRNAYSYPLMTKDLINTPEVCCFMRAFIALSNVFYGVSYDLLPETAMLY